MFVLIYLKNTREEEEEETLVDPKIHHISDTKLDIKQYTHTS